MHKKLLTHTVRLLVMVVTAAIIVTSCTKDEEFQFELDHLLHTPWGIPQVIEPPMGYDSGYIDLDAPTIFYPDGHMSIGSARYDFWSKRDSRSLFIEQAQEMWFIIDLNAERLYVEKSRFPDGTFLGKYLYNPMEE